MLGRHLYLLLSFLYFSDGWNTRQDVVKDQGGVARGSFSIQLASPPYEPFAKHYQSLHPRTNIVNPWFEEFWEHKFNCTLDYNSTSTDKKACTGNEIDSLTHTLTRTHPCTSVRSPTSLQHERRRL